VNTTLLFETIDSFLTDISNVRLVEAGIYSYTLSRWMSFS